MRNTATSSHRSDVAGHWHRHAILGAAEDVRVVRYRRALAEAGLPQAALIDYRDVAGDEPLSSRLGATSLLRIESPGRSFEVYRSLLRYGWCDAEALGVPVIPPDSIARLADDRGLLLCPTQFFCGFRRVMDDLAVALGTDPDLRVTSHPHDIVTLFDKRQCHRLLHDEGVSTPRPLAARHPIGSYEELRDAMSAEGMPRVFIKLSFGSSAAGVVAYHAAGQRELAITTAELAAPARVYCSRRIRRYESREQIRALVDTLCAHGVHVEAWYPKAIVNQRICDLRVLMIGGEPRHIVRRSSRSTLTNLHLLNERGDPDALREKMSGADWESMLNTCVQVAGLFPRCLHLGIDIAVRAGLREHAVLEVNAFGDLLKGVRDRGQTPYDAEISALQQRRDQAA